VKAVRAGAKWTKWTRWRGVAAGEVDKVDKFDTESRFSHFPAKRGDRGRIPGKAEEIPESRSGRANNLKEPLRAGCYFVLYEQNMNIRRRHLFCIQQNRRECTESADSVLSGRLHNAKRWIPRRVSVPVVFRWNGFRFHFFSDEGDPREPVHIHVAKDDVDAKFWLQPEVKVAYNKGFNARTLAKLSRLIEERRQEIERAWDDHFA